MVSRSSTYVVKVSARTWSRETHSLFDFEADPSTVSEHSFDIQDSGTVVRQGNTIEAMAYDDNRNDPNDKQSSSEKLVQVDFRHNNFWLHRPRWGKSDDRRIQRCWELVRSTCGKSSFRLSDGDVVKFGRSQFKVAQLSAKGGLPVCLGGDKESSRGGFSTPRNVCRVDSSKFSELADTPCRICLLEGSSEEDPLITPCQCKGSISHVHVGCLKHWIRDRLGLQEGQDSPFVYNTMCCELCKTAYTTRIQMDGKAIPLVEMSSPFLVFENLNDGRHHVLPIVDDKVIKVGRGHECDMSINDTSISRVQASISLRDGCFHLEDQGSRFGTYVKITKQKSLNKGEPCAVQIGRTILNILVEPAEASAVGPASHPSMAPAIDPCTQGDGCEFVTPEGSESGEVLSARAPNRDMGASSSDVQADAASCRRSMEQDVDEHEVGAASSAMANANYL